MSSLTTAQMIGAVLLVIYAASWFLPSIGRGVAALRAWAANRTAPTVGGNTLSPTVLDDEARAIESAKFLLKWFPPGSPGRTAAKNCWTCLFDKDASGS